MVIKKSSISSGEKLPHKDKNDISIKILKNYHHLFLELGTIVPMMKSKGGKNQDITTNIGLTNIKKKTIKLEKGNQKSQQQILINLYINLINHSI